MQNAVLITLIGLLALSGVTLFYSETTTEKENLQAPLKNTNEQLYKMYLSWKQAHGKNTNTSQEEQYRFNIFSENYQFIKKTNAQKNNTFELGLTTFADLTNEEFRSIYTINRPQIYNSTPEIESFQADTNNASYSDVNWVAAGAVTDIKNQGSCGGCWAFATVGSLEGLNQINGGGLVNLSEQQVIDCSTSLMLHGCNGGFSEYGLKYTAKNGIETSDDYPYTSGTSGKTGVCQYEQSKVFFQNGGQVSVTKKTPLSLNQALVQQPVAVAIDAASLYFQLYTKGIISNNGCGTTLNHEVTLVGYTTSNNTWQIKNSWGTGWGEKGFANVQNTLKDDEGICGINADPHYPTSK